MLRDGLSRKTIEAAIKEHARARLVSLTRSNSRFQH